MSKEDSKAVLQSHWTFSEPIGGDVAPDWPRCWRAVGFLSLPLDSGNNWPVRLASAETLKERFK
jgi:hypothetical protein